MPMVLAGRAVKCPLAAGIASPAWHTNDGCKTGGEGYGYFSKLVLHQTRKHRVRLFPCLTHFWGRSSMVER